MRPTQVRGKQKTSKAIPPNSPKKREADAIFNNNNKQQQQKKKKHNTRKQKQPQKKKNEKGNAMTSAHEELPAEHESLRKCQSDQNRVEEDNGIPNSVNDSESSEEYRSSTSAFGDSDDESEKASLGENQVVYADFEFFDPKQDDFHGVRNLLTTYCDGMEWDLSGFVDIILAQTTVGTVIKTDEDSLFGVITALNLERYKDHSCIMKLQEFLLDKCAGKAEAIELKAFWEKNPHDVGLLLCERVVNLPFELIPPLYDALFDEVSWAIEDEPTQALRDSFQFKHYVLVTKVYQTVQSIRKAYKVAKKEKKKIKKDSLQNGNNGNEENEQIVYIKPEDEIFHQLSTWSFTFPVHAEYVATHEFEGLKTMQLVMAVKADEIPIFRTCLKDLVEGS